MPEADDLASEGDEPCLCLLAEAPEPPLRLRLLVVVFVSKVDACNAGFLPSHHLIILQALVNGGVHGDVGNWADGLLLLPMPGFVVVDIPFPGGGGRDVDGQLAGAARGRLRGGCGSGGR